MIRVTTLFLCVGVMIPTAVFGQDPGAAAAIAAPATPTHVFVAPGDINYQPFELPGFAPGLRLAVIQGDPAGTGAYTVRLAFPDGYSFPAHYHPKDENVTVLNGTFKLGMGTDETAAVETFTPGAFLYMPAEQPHFGSVEGETVVQLHGQGPFEVILANPTS